MAALLGLALAATGCDPGSSAAPTPTASAPVGGTAGATVAPLATRTRAVATIGGTPARGTPPATPGMATPARTPLPVLVGGQTYQDPQGRFSLMAPADWGRIAEGGTAVAFGKTAPDGVPLAAVNVALDPLPDAGVGLEEYTRAAERSLAQQLPDYRPIDLTPVSLDGRPAYRRIFTATIEGQPQQLQQVYLVDRQLAYVITGTTLQEAFRDYSALFDQIAGTFQIGTP